MFPTPRIGGLLATAVLALALLAQPTATTATPGGSPAPPPARALDAANGSQVALDWERIAFRTIYTDAGTPIPVGVPVLGFTSMAMYRAVERSRARRHTSPTAALVTAAHDVLLHYYPTAATALDADETASLGTVPDTRARDRGDGWAPGRRPPWWRAAPMTTFST